jgi:hypothetical protein
MNDLGDRFRVFDRLPAPDLWDEARTRTPRRVAEPDVRRLALIVVAFVIAASGLTAVVLAFWGGSTRTSPAVNPTPTATITGPPGVLPEPSDLGHIATPFVPATHREGDRVVLPVTFPDGGSAELVYPATLDLAGMGAQPDMAFLNGTDYGYFRFYHGDPPASVFQEGASPLVVQDAKGRTVEVIRAGRGQDRWGAYWVVFRFGSWTVLASLDANEDAQAVERARVFAAHLDGRETSDGFVALQATSPIDLVQANGFGEGGGAQVAFGDLDPSQDVVKTAGREFQFVLVSSAYPGLCREGPTSESSDFASACVGNGTIVVHVYGGPSFVKDVAEGIKAMNVRLAS